MPADLPLSPVFRESFLLRCGADQGAKVRAFGGVLQAVGQERWTGAPTWAREELAAALRELRQALAALETCAGNRRGDSRYWTAAAHAAAGLRAIGNTLSLSLEPES